MRSTAATPCFVGGPLISQAGTGTIVLSSSASHGEGVSAPGLILDADIQAGTLSLDSTDGPLGGSDGILQIGGRIIAGTLIGAGYDAGPRRRQPRSARSAPSPPTAALP